MIEQRYEVSEANWNVSSKRIFWGAVIAGVVVTLVTQLLLSLLGLGIGASTIHPVTEENPVSGMGVGAGIWFLISTLLALFAGGCVAGRLANVPRKVDSALHGVLTWASATLLTFFLLTSAVGGLLSGAASVLGKELSATGQQAAMAATSPQQGANAPAQPNQQVTEQKAREMASAAASTVSKAAIWTFIAFVLGGAAAAAGGMVGAPRELTIARTPQQMAA